MIRLLAHGVSIRKALLHKLTSHDEYILSKLSNAEAKNFIELVQKITGSSTIT
jgi:hypothetical protein